MPTLLPSGWKGSLTLLAIVFVLSSFLDNIAGAIIWGAVARVFRGKVHIGYLAAIVAASNAAARARGRGYHNNNDVGLWSQPLRVLEAYIGAFVAFVIFAVPASMQQQCYSPIVKMCAAMSPSTGCGCSSSRRC